MNWRRYQGVAVHYAHRNIEADEFGFYKGTTENAPRTTGTIHVPYYFATGLGEKIYRTAYEAVIGKSAPWAVAEDDWDFEITGIESPIWIAVKEAPHA